MATVKVSDKGQVVIPAEMRKRLGIAPGTQLEFVQEGATIRISVRHTKPVTAVADGFGMLIYRGRRRSLQDFDVAEHLVEGPRTRK